MSYQLPPHERLRAPEYWDGVAIDDFTVFQDAHPPLYETITREQVEYAEAMLLGGMEDILKGGYAELDIPPSRDPDAATTEYPDGSIVILDREYLTRVTHFAPPVPQRGPAPHSYGPAIERPYIPYWLQNQDPASYDLSFGSEQAIFNDSTHYSRELTWGVLLTGEQGNRLVKTWQFAGLRETTEGLHLKAAPSSDEIYRWVGTVSIHDRFARPVPETHHTRPTPRGRRRLRPSLPLPPTEFAIRSIKRLKNAAIIYTSRGELPLVPSLHRFDKGVVLTSAGRRQ